MKSLCHLVIQIVFVCCVTGFLCLGTVHRASCEETPSPVPSLADVVYQAGTLTQRLATLKSSTGTTGILQKLEPRLKQAGSEVGRFQTRLSLLKDEDLQSYQQLAALKGEVRSEADAVRRVTQSLTETIRDVELRRREWLAEKHRWDQWRPSTRTSNAPHAFAQRHCVIHTLSQRNGVGLNAKASVLLVASLGHREETLRVIGFFV